MPEAIDSPHYDKALAVAIRLLELFDTADAPKPILLGKVTFVILEGIRELRPMPPDFGKPSAN
jgi:hypothetical protein